MVFHFLRHKPLILSVTGKFSLSTTEKDHRGHAKLGLIVFDP